MQVFVKEQERLQPPTCILLLVMINSVGIREVESAAFKA